MQSDPYQAAKDKGYIPLEDGNVVGPRGANLSLATGTSGYKFFSYRVPGGKHKSIPVHQYMAWYFLGPEALEHDCIRHLDGDRNNNRLENLKPGSNSENFQDNSSEWKTHFARRGASLKRKLNDEQVAEIKILLSNGASLRQIAEKYNVAKTTVEQIKKGKSYAWIK